ncbi:MAG TPA: hypothetical protein VF832_18135 [Longimicrobiales bacterium]
MAIRDLLWACPLCGTVGGIAPAGKAEACSACGASFRRAQAARIEAHRADGRTETRSATEWSALLPAEPPVTALPADGREGAPSEGQGRVLVRRDRVLARFARGEQAIRHAGRFIGMMERFGPERAGELVLRQESIELDLEDGERREWPLDRVAALQASSRTVQLRPRGEPIISFRFPESSARLWEESIAAALRRRWRETGRGEILELQPRIVTQPADAPAGGWPQTTSSPAASTEASPPGSPPPPSSGGSR